MILLLDIGNTFLKWAACSDGKLLKKGEFLHAGQPLHEAFATAWGAITTPRRVVAASVAGNALAGALDGWVAQHWQLAVDYAESGATALGVSNAYLEPARLGVDRWLAMLAAFQQCRGQVCVIDCGTALTVDAVSASGQHLGGLILPGLGMMRDALLRGTEGVNYDTEPDLTSDDDSPALLANDTRGAVEAGSLYAIVAFIERIVADLERETGQPMSVLLTGGDAPDIELLLSRGAEYRPALVLEGLALSVNEDCGGIH